MAGDQSAQEGQGQGMPALRGVPPIALVITAIVSIQFGAALAATLFDRLPPGAVSALRLGLAAIILVALWRPWRTRHTAQALRLAALLGVVLGLMNLMFFYAVDRVPLGVVVTIEFLGPIAVGAIFSARRRDLVWPGLALLGVVLLAQPWKGEGGLDPLGLALAAVAGALWGLYIVVAERASREFDGAQGLSISMVGGALVALVPGIAGGGLGQLDLPILGIALAVALASSVIPYTLETGRSVHPRGCSGVLMSMEPPSPPWPGSSSWARRSTRYSSWRWVSWCWPASGSRAPPPSWRARGLDGLLRRPRRAAGGRPAGCEPGRGPPYWGSSCSRSTSPTRSP